MTHSESMIAAPARWLCCTCVYAKISHEILAMLYAAQSRIISVPSLSIYAVRSCTCTVEAAYDYGHRCRLFGSCFSSHPESVVLIGLTLQRYSSIEPLLSTISNIFRR